MRGGPLRLEHMNVHDFHKDGYDRLRLVVSSRFLEPTRDSLLRSPAGRDLQYFRLFLQPKY